MTRALGGVRALDVALGILDDLRDRDDAASTSVLDVVREDLIDERRRLRDKMGARVSEAEALALPEQLEAVAPGTQAGSDARRRAMLAERVTKRADRLEAAIDEAGALYAPERLHQVRIAAKQLRYALELVHEFGGVGTRRLTVRLKDVQDILGRLHDLEFVFSRIRRRSWPAGSEEAAGAARLLDMIEREIRERHADYLARLDGCRSVVTACRGAVAPRLAAARGRRRLARDDGHPGPVAPRRNR